MWRYQDHVLNEISEVVEATSKQHDNTQVDIAAAQRAKRKNVHIVFAKTYFSQGAFRFTAKSGSSSSGVSVYKRISIQKKIEGD